MTRFLILTAILFAAQMSASAKDLIQSSVLENNVAYLRVGDAGKNLPDEIQSAQKALAATNKIAGTVLDLRFADGNDLDSAKAVADSVAQQKLPVAILMNDETRGAAEKLAEDLRDAKAGLIFGSSRKLTPDISISVNTNEEIQFLKNPWATISTNKVHQASATNFFLPFVDHTTEADLVRAKVKDDGNENFADDHSAGSQKPFIRDPVLARAVDFIKGLAIVRQWHS